MGLSTIRKKPETRFPTIFWLAKPRIIPVIPPASRSPEGSRPIRGRIEIKTTISVP